MKKLIGKTGDEAEAAERGNVERRKKQEGKSRIANGDRGGNLARTSMRRERKKEELAPSRPAFATR